MTQDQRPKATEIKRQAVLKAASWQFAEKGYKGATVEGIASTASVSKGLVFYFYKNKKLLFNAVLDDGISQWVTLTEQRMSGEDGNYTAVIREIFLASFDFIEQHPILLLLMREQSFPQSIYARKQLAKNNKRWRKRVERVLLAGKKSKEFKRAIDPKTTADIIHELQISLIQSMYKQGKIKALDKKLIDHATKFVIHAISH